MLFYKKRIDDTIVPEYCLCYTAAVFCFLRGESVFIIIDVLLDIKGNPCCKNVCTNKNVAVKTTVL